jgi:hypothetical protein
MNKRETARMDHLHMHLRDRARTARHNAAMAERRHLYRIADQLRASAMAYTYAAEKVYATFLGEEDDDANRARTGAGEKVPHDADPVVAQPV